MAKIISPKCKMCRRAGEKLFLKGERCSTVKCSIVKRNFPPGFQGSKSGRKRLTDYGTQLNEKQKAKRQYNMMEKQFLLTFEKAKAKSGNTGSNFIKLLESRFDNTVYRSGLASSRPQARQMINHGLLTINNQKVTIPSYIVKTGDEIKIKTNKKNSKIFQGLNEKLQKNDTPSWIYLDAKTLAIKVLHQPNVDILKPNFNVQIIVEYYSR